MPERPAERKSPIPWRKLHAFGLPEGSVRALLAILIFGTVWTLLLLRPDREVPDYLQNLLFIIMGHYFAARNRPETVEDPGPPPLFLPRGSVRLLLVLGSLAVVVLLTIKHRLLPMAQNRGVMTLVLMGGFLLGVIMARIFAWCRERGHRPSRRVEDLRAAISLAAAMFLVVLVWNQYFPFFQMPAGGLFGALRRELGSYGPEEVAAAIVGFYFGSRS